MAGALLEEECKDLLKQAGFVDIDLKTVRVYDLDTPEGQSLMPGISEAARREYNGAITSTFISAVKP